MKITDSTFFLLKECEGLRLKAYQCPAKVWTIGIGNTFYLDGTPVKQGDTISMDKAIKLFYSVGAKFEKSVNSLVTKPLTQHQWDVMFSICWQYGAAWLKRSLILRQINKDPSDLKEIRTILNIMEYDNRRNIEFKHYSV